MNENFTQISKLLNPIVNPKRGKFIRENEGVVWFPLITINDSGSQMGVSKNSEWVVEVSEGIHHLDNPQLYTYVMALLEKPLSVVHRHILNLLKGLPMEEEPLIIFPFTSIINAGFEQGSDYWAELAFKWYYELSNKQKIELKATIFKVYNAKWASQKTKHTARKELAKLRKIK